MVMKIYNNANLNKKHTKGVIAIGNFDGLHLGHQKVINEAKKNGHEIDLINLHDEKPIPFFASFINVSLID